MTDRDPIAACIEARARDLHAVLADAVDGAPRWRPRAKRLLAAIEAMAMQSVNAAIAAQKTAASAIVPPPYALCHQPTVCAGLGYCPHMPTQEHDLWPMSKHKLRQSAKYSATRQPTDGQSG